MFISNDTFMYIYIFDAKAFKIATKLDHEAIKY